MKSEKNELPVGLSAPALRALFAAGYDTLNKLAGASESQLLGLHGVGPKAIRIIREALIEHGQDLK